MIETALKYIVLTSAIVGFLALLGWPISRFLHFNDEFRVPVPVVGMCVLPLLSWYWLEITGLGLRPLIIGLLVTLTVLDAIMFVRLRSTLHLRPVVAVFLCAGFATAALCAVNYESALHLDYVTTTSSGNADAADWVQTSQHLNDRGFDETGNVAGYDFGETVKTAGFGGAVLLAAATTVTGKETFQVGLAALFAAIAMVLLATARLIERFCGLKRVASLVVATACISPMLFFYVASNFFLAQIMSMAVIPCILLALIRLSEVDSRTDIVRVSVLLSILLFFLLSAYAHMTFLALPLLAPIAIIVGVKGGFRRRLLKVVVGGSIGLVLALAVAPNFTMLSYRRAIQIGTQQAGWTLPAFLPTELLGFGRGLYPELTTLRIVASVAIVILAAWSAWRLLRRGVLGAGFSIGVVAIILLSYALIYWREGGGTYRQWKWITFFQPMFVASVLSLLVMQIRESMAIAGSRLSILRTHFSGEALACLAAVALVIISSLNGQEALAPLIRGPRPFQVADRQLADLETNPSLKAVNELNIDVTPYWDTMFASYFLRDKTVYLLEPTHYALSLPTAPWTLDRVDSGPLPTGQQSVAVNETYRLVQQPPAPFSDVSSVLDARLTVLSDQVVGGKRMLQVQAVNTGRTTWLPSTAPLGAVQVGGSLVDDEGNVVQLDLFRAPFAVTKPVAPGWSVDATVTAEEHYDLGHLEIQLVAEGVARFGNSILIDSADLTIP